MIAWRFIRRRTTPKTDPDDDGCIYTCSNVPTSIEPALRRARRNRRHQIERGYRVSWIYPVILLKFYPVWIEGYATNGQHATAEFLGCWLGRTFEQACYRACRRRFGEMTYYKVHDGIPYHWACRLFDNETDARRQFG